MKILYSYRTEDERQRAEKALSGNEIIFHEGSIQTGDWNGEGVEALCVFVDSHVGKEEFDKLPDLKFIAAKSTGFDYIDHDTAKERDVVVSNVPSYGEHTVAEFAFALLLSVSRNLFAAKEKVDKGDFNPDGLTGFDLNGKVFGVLGTGRIGRNVVRIAKGFGMSLIGFDLYPDEKFADEVGLKYFSMEEVISQADILSLHLPENEDTHHIIGREQVSKMKKGVVLINTARGSIMDTEALVWGLENEIISGAGIDVLSEEGNVDDEMRLLANPHPNQENMKTLLMNHYLIDHPRVVITPHVAFNTKEAVQRILETSFDNVKKFIEGNPQNVI